VPTNRLDAVAISHLHPDHYFDLVALYYCLKFGEPRPPELPPRLPVLVPPGGLEFLAQLTDLIAAKPALFLDMFDLQEYSPANNVRIGELEVTFHPVQHYVLSHAIRVRSGSGKTLVFSSDVAPCPGIVEAAAGADLLLCESALLEASQDDADPRRRGHMTAAEAGAAASAAGARRLVITHYRSNEEADGHHLAAARAAYAGPVELAREGTTYTID
jgi:ribonuclease BN (tRNA processing enzyme)